MHDPASLVATWWSYAQASPSVLGVAVIALATGAVGFVATRVIADVRARRRR